VSLAAFVFLNWSIIAGIFNYKNIYSEIFFNNKNNNQELIKENLVAEENVYFEKIDSIEISKLNITAPLVFIKNNELTTFDNGLDRGVVHFPDSVLPGESGQIIILGHSAPANWIAKNYENIFSEINELKKGDKVNIFYNHKKYIYNIKEQIVLDKGQNVPVLEGYDKQLALVTCWPPGKNIRRMAVLAAQK